MSQHHLQIAFAAISTAQVKPAATDVTALTRAMSALLTPLPSFWRVVGMTPLALSILADNLDAKRLPKGIQRAHLRKRADTVTNIINGPALTFAEFEAIVTGEADHTILCGPGENNDRLADRDDLIRFDNEGDDPLFQPRGFAARWSDAERELVRHLLGADAV